VELHGGRIEAQRGDHGVGTRFVVELMAARSSVPRGSMAKAPAPMS